MKVTRLPGNPSNFGPGRNGTIESLSIRQMATILGFMPTVVDPDGEGDGKVTREWWFRVDGVVCGIWDYKGARWSCNGPSLQMKAVFGDHYRPDIWYKS